MAFIIRWLIPLTVWAGALFGCLQLHTLNLGHSICGPWGCGPPTSALLAMHSFWLLVLLPLGVVAACSWPRFNWQRTGRCMVFLAIAVVVGIGVYDYFTFQRDPAQPVYVWQRFLFRLATFPDWPIVQLGIAGAVMARFGRKTGGKATDEEELSDDEAQLESDLSLPT